MKTNFSQKLGAIALCFLSLAASSAYIGCSQQTGTQVAQDIVNWTPSLVSAVGTIDATASLLLPSDAPIFTAATAAFDALSATVVADAKAYLANPSASVLANLQTAITSLEQSVNNAVLQAAGIKDTNSQKLALAAINGVGTIVSTILALVQGISSKTAVAKMSTEAPIKYAQVRPYMDEQGLEQAAKIESARYKVPVTVNGFFAQEAQAGF